MEREIKIPLKKLAFILLILVALSLAFLLVKTYFYFGKYVAVYLRTGEIYFGKLQYFPKLTLKDAVLLQTGQNNQLNLLPLVNTFWHSKGYLILNKQNIVWISPIRENSPFIIQLKSLTNQTNVLQTPPQPNATSSQ